MRPKWTRVDESLAVADIMRSIAEILELQRDGKLLGSDGADHRLQFIAAFGRDANLLVLDLRRDLELALADEASDFLGHERLDALLDLDGLARVAEGGKIGLGALDVFHADAALGQLADDDFL